MKRGTPRHPKTKQLARLLDVPIYAAVGLLEMLWHFASEYTPQGDVGRYADTEIAEAIGWSHDPSTLIRALVDAKYVDEDPTHRLLIHDFHEHAEESVRKRLLRNHLSFLTIRHTRASRRVATMSRHGDDVSRLARGEGEGIGEGKAMAEGECEGKPATRSARDDGFAAFYALYPRKRKPEDARKAWRQIVTTPDLRARIMTVLPAHIASEEWAREGGRFIPYPATWLRAHEWDDLLTVPVAAAEPYVPALQRIREAKAARLAAGGSS